MQVYAYSPLLAHLRVSPCGPRPATLRQAEEEERLASEAAEKLRLEREATDPNGWAIREMVQGACSLAWLGPLPAAGQTLVRGPGSVGRGGWLGGRQAVGQPCGACLSPRTRVTLMEGRCLAHACP